MNIVLLPETIAIFEQLYQCWGKWGLNEDRDLLRVHVEGYITFSLIKKAKFHFVS